MIYATTSGMPFPFWRLIKKMDDIAGQIEEEVVIQGAVDYETRNASYFRYFRRHEADDMLRKARLIVSHAGAGTIIKAIEYSTPIIILPRLKKLNEHYSDHQIELARAMDGRKGIKVIYDIDELDNVLDFSEKPENTEGINSGITQDIKSYINSL